MKYTVKFVYHGRLKIIETSKSIADGIERIYFNLYNEFVNLVNPKFAEWNDEFDRIFPNCDGNSDEYNQFIRQKQLAVADSFNKSLTSPAERSSGICCHIGIGDENNPILYIPNLGNYESGDYVEFYLVQES